MTSAYVNVKDVQQFPSGLETASLVGNVVRLLGNVSAGATSLSVTPSVTVAISAWDNVYIFDGANSEQIIASGNVSIGGSGIPINGTPLQYAHSAGCLVVTDGVSGSLAQEIFDASGVLENICNQPRFLATYTDVLTLGTEQAAINQQLEMLLKPYTWPVQSVTSIVATRYGVTTNYGVSNALLENGGKSIRIPNLTPIDNNDVQNIAYPLVTQQGWRSTNVLGDVTLTYTAGYSKVPGHIRKACIYLVCDVLSKRFNPSGMFEIQQNRRKIQAFAPTDASGIGSWRRLAEKELQQEIQRAV